MFLAEHTRIYSHNSQFITIQRRNGYCQNVSWRNEIRVRYAKEICSFDRFISVIKARYWILVHVAEYLLMLKHCCSTNVVYIVIIGKTLRY